MSLHCVYHTQHYAWPLMETLFSEVLSREDWLKLWDNVFSNHPSFLLFLLISYLTTARHTLLHCTSTEDLKVSFVHLSHNIIENKLVFC